jgi:tetratricopeptide (TPR) repeat protein
VLLGSVAQAQYRPRPPTEAEQLTSDADAERAEAAKKDAAGDRAGAATKYVKAIELYEKALASDPELATAATGLGAACVARRDYARAVKDLTPFHGAHPDAAQVSFDLGLSLFKLNRFGEAIPLLEALAKADAPEHFMAHYYLGSYALGQRDGVRAVDEFGLYLKRRPTDLAVGDSQVEELLGRGYLLQKRPAEARAAFERAQKEKPSIGAQIGISAAMELEGKDALGFVEKLDHKQPEVLDRLARMYLQRGNLPKANENANALVQMHKSPNAFLLLGDVRGAQKDWKGSADAYRESLKAQRTTPALLGLQRALESVGQNEQAIAELEKSAGDDPMLIAPLGSAYRRAGHFQKALETHGKLSKKEAQTHILLGADHFATGQWDEAIRDYSNALEIDAQNARAKHCLALALSRRAHGAKLDQAVLDLRRAYDLEPIEPAAQLLAAIEIQQQKFAEAEKTLGNYSSTESRLLMGYALLGQERGKESLAIFEKLSQPEAQIGWALSKAQLDEIEPALKKLQGVKSGQANLAQLMVKLSWKRLAEGDAAAASRELQSLPTLPAGGATAQVAELLKALIAVENKQYGPALQQIRGALAEKKWFEPQAKPILEAYVAYRQGKLADARKQLAAVQKQKLPFATKLSKALDDKEAEQLYAQNGPLPKIEKLLKGDEDPRAQNNLACARYRHAGQAQAVATWKTLKLPEAELNLGLHALQSEKDPKSALAHFRRYNGPRASQVREWSERLQQLYGDEK